MFKISAVISAHNPRKDYFPKVLEGLKKQGMPLKEWELIIIDNMSKEKLEDIYQIDWHPHHRFIIEENLGLAHARKRGFEEAVGDLLINIDDDIILTSDYLENAWHIYNKYPFIGVFGGEIHPDFEAKPTLKIEYYKNAQRIIEKDIWSNNIDEFSSTPFGAGMCIRNEVFKSYLRVLETDEFRLNLGRKGEELLSCEDIDLVFFACQKGYGKGMFKSLSFKHFFPENKMAKKHLINNYYWNTYSATLQNFHLFNKMPRKRSLTQKLIRFLRIIKMDSFKRKVEFAKIKAEKEALKKLKI
ncbi:glycosyltransferase [Pedobacter montanisoli]|uniref:Glycosyltransferase n=1 Tax=Pedobacter montanisoli TaxID=2923277 RepID=A0ABS9ZVW6_9SPHI|nr:glycosyltransferase [Pedobacter montanisoli]MCJ0742444.1 glycosyltransferase [Pedobacter montanisoli]